MLHQRAEPAAALLAGVAASRAIFEPCLSGSGTRLLWVAHVDQDTRCIHLSGHDHFGENGALPAREILREVAELGSAGMILARAGSEEALAPTSDHVRNVRLLADAAEAIDCTLVDHLVFTPAGCRSMRRMSLL